MDHIFIYNIMDFYNLLGLHQWNELETQLEKDISRLRYNLDGVIITNIYQLWKEYGPLTMNTLKCLTQNVFYPGLQLLYDNYNSMFVQHPLYHHYINKNKNIITTQTTQQSIKVDPITNDIITGKIINIITTICSPIVTIEFKEIEEVNI